MLFNWSIPYKFPHENHDWALNVQNKIALYGSVTIEHDVRSKVCGVLCGHSS